MQKKRRILLTSPSALNNGGVQHVLMTIVRNFSDLFIFDILTFNSIHDFYNNEFKSYGGNIYCFNPNNKKGFSLKLLVARKFKRYLKNLFNANDYYAVHCNSQFYNSTILKLAKKHDISIRLSHAHGTYKKENFFREFYRNICRKTIKRYATKLVGCSDLSCQSFYGTNDDYYVLNNPYDSKRIFPVKKTPQNLCLLQIGLFCEIKNQNFTLDVLSIIKKNNPNVLLRLVGNGDIDFLKEKIRKLGLENNVFIHKQDEDKRFLFENSSYLIMPSLHEGFPIVLIEAQAGGMYCFASDSITKASNLGGVQYLSLNKGPEFWADFIMSYYLVNKGSKSVFDCSKYTIDYFNNEIRKVYEIEDNL